MDWEVAGLTPQILTWLESASDTRYAGERRLDSFATSMRDFDDVSAQLEQIRSGSDLNHSDLGQRLTDLRNAGLVEGGPDGAKLTGLGAATLDAWQHFDVATNSKHDELARVLLLVLNARMLGIAQYENYFNYWQELRTTFSPMQLIDSWDTLYVLNYLDLEVGGFAPGKVFRDLGIPFNDIDGDLDVFVDKIGGSARAKEGAIRLARAIKGKVPRGRGRANFAIAMELLAEAGHPTPRSLLATFGYPNKPRQWEKFDEARVSKIEAILDSYGVRAVSVDRDPNSPDSVDEESPQNEHGSYALPTEIDFSQVLQPVPRPKPKRPGAVGRGSGARKVDYVAKQKRDGLVGELGERFALEFERWRLRDHPELKDRVVHVSLDDDTLGYDIKSYEADGSPRLVEVKASLGPMSDRFFLSSNELKCAGENPEAYLILRVGSLNGRIECCEIRYPFDELELETVMYVAAFKSKAE